MGLFSGIMSKIWGQASAATMPASAAATSAPQTPPVNTTAPATAAAPAPVVDVTAVLDGLAAHNKEKLNWRLSIVDLMKLVGIESSLSARKELAAELNYTGDTSDSAKMNVWLHKEVIKKLAANGGKVPADLLD
jgi:hypothetical protein